jgi:hypothetical protein
MQGKQDFGRNTASMCAMHLVSTNDKQQRLRREKNRKAEASHSVGVRVRKAVVCFDPRYTLCVEREKEAYALYFHATLPPLYTSFLVCSFCSTELTQIPTYINLTTLGWWVQWTRRAGSVKWQKFSNNRM